ncbi:MAG: hypothetical protein H0T84_00280 [Tatlockia sp.]|nr:hypothetical protein [Tatlockia sp.]
MEQEQEIFIKNYTMANLKIDTTIDGYFSLNALLLNLLKPTIKPMPYESHLVFLKGITSTIFKQVIKRFCEDSDFNAKQNGAYVADINIYDTNDLYISPEWIKTVKGCLTKITMEKTFPKKESLHSESSSTPKLISLIENKIFEIIKSLLKAELKAALRPLTENSENSGHSL